MMLTGSEREDEDDDHRGSRRDPPSASGVAALPVWCYNSLGCVSRESVKRDQFEASGVAKQATVSQVGGAGRNEILKLVTP